MKFIKKIKDTRWFAYTVATCSAVILYVLLTNLGMFGAVLKKFFRLISPVTIGIIIAYILNPFTVLVEKTVLKKIKKDKTRHVLSMVITFAVVILIIVLILAALIPQVIGSISQFVGNINVYAASLRRMLNGNSIEIAGMKIQMGALNNIANDAISKVTQFFSNNTNSIINASVSAGGSALNFVIGVILAIYFLADKASLVKFVKRASIRIVSPKRYPSFSRFMGKCHKIVVKYVAYDIIDGLIVAITNFIFMIVTGMPYAVMISVVVGVTNLAPSIGPLVGGVIGGFILLLINPTKALIFLIFTVILQTIDGYVLKPKLFGNILGVPGVWLIVALVVGGKLFGVAGILLSIPFAAIVNFMYKENSIDSIKRQFSSKRKKENLEDDSSEHDVINKPDKKINKGK